MKAQPGAIDVPKALILWWRVSYPLRGLAYANLVLLLTLFGGSTQKFIYFDF